MKQLVIPALVAISISLVIGSCARAPEKTVKDRARSAAPQSSDEGAGGGQTSQTTSYPESEKRKKVKTTGQALPDLFPTDVPLVENTYVKTAAGSLIGKVYVLLVNFEVPLGRDQAVDFYRDELVKNGWKEVDPPITANNTVTLSYNKGKKNVRMTISNQVPALVELNIQIFQ